MADSLKLPTDEELKRIEETATKSKEKREENEKQRIEMERQAALEKLTGGK